MEHLPPLGRHFIEKAETLADYAIANPVQTVEDVNFEIYGQRNHVAKAILTLPDGTTLDGFAKSTTPQHAARHIMIGQLATLLGAPSAPYILLYGKVDLPVTHSEHDTNLALFSPAPFEDFTLHSQSFGEDELSADHLSPITDSTSLGAAGQFRAWIHDGDVLTDNMVRDVRTRTLCLFDHEAAEPASNFYDDGQKLQKGLGVEFVNHQFILQGWKSRGYSNVERFTYLEGAKAMANRIQNVKPLDLRRLAEDNAEAGMAFDKPFIDGLLRRRALFERPAVVTIHAERACFNMGPYVRPQKLKLG